MNSFVSEQYLCASPISTQRTAAALQQGRPERYRVLITVDMASWIIGQMALEIMRVFDERYEFWFFTDKVLKLRPDIVRSLATTVAFAFPLTDQGVALLNKALRGQKLPFIFWMHHVTEWTDDMREAVGTADEIVACTENWKSQLQDEAGPAAPVTVVPHGVDLDEFKRLPSQKKSFGVPEEPFVIGFVGSKRSHADGGRKGLDTLQQVIAQCRDRIGNIHISFLGLGWEEQVAQLRAQGISANYSGFVGRSRLPAFYSSIDAYLMTSRIEGGPCTVLEAMACETPVVATRVGLVPECIEDGSNGFSAEPGDAEALTNALCALAASPDLRSRIGHEARAKIEATRSWDMVLESLREPLRRMESLHPDSGVVTDVARSEAPRRWRRAVQAIDGALSVLLNCKRGMTGPAVSARMLAACWEGLGPADIMRGLAIMNPLALGRRHSSKDASTA